MAARTLNGWLVRQHPGKGTFVAPNGKTVYCADDDVAEVGRYVIEQWDKRIEKLPKATHNTYPYERHGYIVVHCSRPTPLNGLKNSNHLSQTAWDVLGDKHHYERSCSMANGNSCWGDGKPHKYISGFSAKQEAELRKIAAEVDAMAGKKIIRLGIDFLPGWRDAMHFELNPGTTNADVARVATILRARRKADEVVDLAAGVTDNLEFLGYEGSVKGVRAFQTDHGLTVDGIVGRNTSARLEIEVSAVEDRINAKIESIPAKVWSVMGAKPGEREPSVYMGTLLRYAAQGSQVSMLSEQVASQAAEIAGLKTAVVELASTRDIDPQALADKFAAAVKEAAEGMKFVFSHAPMEEEEDPA